MLQARQDNLEEQERSVMQQLTQQNTPEQVELLVAELQVPCVCGNCFALRADVLVEGACTEATEGPR